MNNPNRHASDPVELSIAAALQLNELGRGTRDSAPALSSFFDYLRKPKKASDGNSMNVLSDFRSYTLLRDAMRSKNPTFGDSHEFSSEIGSVLQEIESGVLEKNSASIKEATQFCLNLNSLFLSRR